MSMTKEGQVATSTTISIGDHERAISGYLRYDVLPLLSKEIDEQFLGACQALDQAIRAFEGLERQAGLTQGLKTVILAFGQDSAGGYEVPKDRIAMIHDIAQSLVDLRSKLVKSIS